MRSKPAVRVVHLSELKTDPEVNRNIDQHWVDRLVKNWHAEAIGTPIVASRNGHYVILDGQHRIEAVRQMTSADDRIEVKVIDGLSIPEMARLFVELNEDRNIRAFTKFEKRVTAGDPDATAIAAVVKRLGLKLMDEPHDGSIGAVVALEAVFHYDAGGQLLEDTLVTLLGSFGKGWDSFNGNLVRGVGQFYRRFPEADRARTVKVLAATAGGPYGMLGKGRTMKEVHGGSVAAGVTQAILALYNRRLRDKLGE
jgi:hypothetical protein